MKRWLVLLLTALALHAGEIKIAVAANVSFAIDDLIEAFHTSYPDTKVQVLLGSSGKLAAQIENGAPFALFMSADMKFPKALYRSGAAITRPLIYAQGSLALLSTTPRDFSKGLALLKEPSIHKIAIANAKTAPYGKAASEALHRSGLYDTLRSKFIFGESVGQTVSYTVTAADIGLVARSSLYAPQMAKYRKGVHWISVDPKLYTPIDQGVVLLKPGARNPEAAAFFAFLFSKKAEKIFRRYGYAIP